MTRCTNLTGRHCYEAVYDEVPNEAQIEATKQVTMMAIEKRGPITSDWPRALRVYVQSVCRYCGDVVDRMEK